MSDDTAPGDIPIDADTWAWLQTEAAEKYQGSIAALVGTLLTAARLAETSADPWAALQHRDTSRGPWPRYRIPVPVLLNFCDAWQPDRDGHTAGDVLAALRRNLAH